MSIKWTEGIDYEVLPDQKVRCLHCNRVLESKAGLGPHLSRCVKPSMEAPPKPTEEAEISLDEKQNLIETLKKFGVRYAEAIASFLEPFGFEDLDTLDEALRLSQVDSGKRKLIITYWANHVQKPIPPGLMQRWSQPTFSPIEMQPPTFQTQQGLTKEDLDKWYAEKQKEQEIQQLRAEIQELRQQLSEGNPKKSSELEEIKKLLLEKERNEVLDRLRRLEDYVHGPISNVYGLLGLTVKETADIIKNSPLRHYILTGQLPSPPKEVEPQAREGIFERLSTKYVVEE